MPVGDFRIIGGKSSGAQAVLASSQRAFARHMHDQFGIGVMERGGQLSHSGRGQVEAGAGDVITVNPGEIHDGVPTGDSGRAWRIVYLDPPMVERAAFDIRMGRDGDFELSYPVLRDRRASVLVRCLFEAVARSPDQMRREELLLATLAALGGEIRPAATGAIRSEIARARSLIDDDPASAISLADLAQVSGLGRFQLLRGFARAIGLTPHAYLIQRRVELARRLIIEGAALADAAAAAGFSDQSHMTRAFARRYGLTPGAYATARR